MSFRLSTFPRTTAVLCATAILFAVPGCTKKSSAQTAPVDLKLRCESARSVSSLTATHDSTIRKTRKPRILRCDVALVEAIADVDPAFVCFTGDIVYNGNDTNDWKVWDRETSSWREKKITVYPALGNHDLHGEERALGNYFARFPELKDSRYYSVREPIRLLVLDSSLRRNLRPARRLVDGETRPCPRRCGFRLSDVSSSALLEFFRRTDVRRRALRSLQGTGARHDARGRQAHAPYRMVVFRDTFIITSATSMAA